MVMLRRLAVGALIVVIAAIAYVRLAPVNASALAYSVAGEVGGSALTHHECRPRHDTWLCSIDDPEGSGNASDYTVRLRGRRCWTATRTGGILNRRLRGRASGCVGLRDRIRLVERLSDINPATITAVMRTPGG
jgi:hypothetical protein